MPRDAVSIVPEQLGHHADIAALLDTAFVGTDESRLVARLRRDGLVAASLVAIDHVAVLGHILFSRVAVSVDGRPVEAVSLAPMAVRPDCQRQGIGGRLITAGLAAMRDQGRQAVIVVGHPAYYPRFGFSAALARHLASPYAGDAFMALELTPAVLSGERGTVVYPSAFDGI
jgi:putative acetyltransferase